MTEQNINIKKPWLLRNTTKYFDPDRTKCFNRIQSTVSYSARKQKIEGYENRLYWQYRYCEDNNGQTFFYTLTYNDKAMPTYLGKNCFDYEDLRDLLTGGFRKQLLRNYGTLFKYFIGAELGDGKGSRGLANNPHYHVLFFLEPAKDSSYPYKRILPEQFRHLVRIYWQGFDQGDTGFCDFRTAKYGIAQEGHHCGLVVNYRACVYCAKYVCKDAGLVQHEDDVRRHLFGKYDGDITKLKDGLNEYRNRYCNKVRISHGLGLYALESVKDILEPRIAFPSKKGFKFRPINLYYFRKLYMDVVKDSKGSNLYVLNSLGIEYRLHKLPSLLEKKADTFRCNLSLLLADRSLFDKMVKSDVNTDVHFSYSDFFYDVNGNCSLSVSELSKRYAEYKLIYEDRYFRHNKDITAFPEILPEEDYLNFIYPSLYTVARSSFSLDYFLNKCSNEYLGYYAHPYFLPYLRIFSVLDLCSDYLFIQNDNKLQKDAEEKTAIKRFHSQRKFNDFINTFQNV